MIRQGYKHGGRIKQSLSERGYQDVFPLFSQLKDWNEDLQAMAKPPPELVEGQGMSMQM